MCRACQRGCDEDAVSKLLLSNLDFENCEILSVQSFTDDMALPTAAVKFKLVRTR